MQTSNQQRIDLISPRQSWFCKLLFLFVALVALLYPLGAGGTSVAAGMDAVSDYDCKDAGGRKCREHIFESGQCEALHLILDCKQKNKIHMKCPGSSAG